MMSNWFERKAEDWFGTPEKKMRLLQWLVYITNLYVIFGIFVLIWLLYGDYIIQAWEYFSGAS
ncbi:MAG: hypothetical protein IPI63_03440 [Methanothrix sp.]|uniref:hypothetical protein n=2 Tax=Methanothrix sp. TaxID=90426 RepID=UPI0025D60F6F|nr:hypothetical protein [Methanothrix sp.]MBK7385814.1 hypothetical protein [Methanothrix sp.]